MSELQTFHLPDHVTGSRADAALARDMIRAWRTDGIFQVARTAEQDARTERAFAASRRFFRMPFAFKSSCVSDLSYSGYVASREEETAGERDYSEIFTVTPDIPLEDPRVGARWPCHGPAPWPDDEYRDSMKGLMNELGSIGERLLALTAIGLELPEMNALRALTAGGWHHMRVLRFQSAIAESARGIGAHTDYGLLVIAAQTDAPGLYIRPPVEGEKRNRNWLPGESMAGVYEHDEPWHLVKPVPSVFTVFPGDMMQFLTGGYLLSTPHKVRLAEQERFALAYFHEPNFETVVRPLRTASAGESIHYGSHFTRMFMRCYPQRITTQRIVEEDRLNLFLQGDPPC
jgi:isopenicillin N synthase-like dioxygenase